MGETGVVERFVNRLVRVAVIDVLADDGDRHLLLRMADPLHQVLPIVHLQRAGGQAQLFDDQVVQPVFGQAQRHFVDRELLIHLFDDGPRFDVAEEGDLVAVLATQRPLRPHDQNVGLNADLPKLADAVLRGLRLGFPRRLEIGHERQMDEQAILLADVERNLPDRLEKRQPLDVAGRSAQLGNHDVDARTGQVPHGGLDFVGDVGNDLDRAAQIFAAALFLDHAEINLARRVVRFARQRAVGETLVMSQVEVGLGAVVEDVHLAVLVRAHRARIDVDVRIELLHPHAQSAAFQEQADRRRGEPLAQAAHHAPRHKDVFCHSSSGKVPACRFQHSAIGTEEIQNDQARTDGNMAHLRHAAARPRIRSTKRA